MPATTTSPRTTTAKKDDAPAAVTESGAVYVAVESGCSSIDGVDMPFTKGVTHVREGHPLLAACPDYFRPATERVHYDVEDASADPGRRRGR